MNWGFMYSSAKAVIQQQGTCSKQREMISELKMHGLIGKPAFTLACGPETLFCGKELITEIAFSVGPRPLNVGAYWTLE